MRLTIFLLLSILMASLALASPDNTTVGDACDPSQAQEATRYRDYYDPCNQAYLGCSANGTCQMRNCRSSLDYEAFPCPDWIPQPPVCANDTYCPGNGLGR